MESIINFFSHLTLGKKLLLLLSPVITLLLSLKALILGLFLLIFVDLITGIRKNLFLKKIPFNPLASGFWVKIKSYLLRRTWVKWTEYTLGIISVVILEALVIGETNISLINREFSLSELSVAIPACIEVWSIFENIVIISNNNSLKNVFSYLKNKIKTKLKNADITKHKTESN